MKDRVLKQYTIVPVNLYVERDADRQLKDILSSMQRPGYVLVSRQMGKTNLLLHAKKTLQSESDIFVYLDLSNRFNNERDCFENIIDTAIATHESLLECAKEEIAQLRANNTRSFQREHTEELKILLKYIKGKLVIILDEIDALTKTAYSDNIFSQIRSIYFDRVNYPILERLTYVLSGVVEPTEIIKDPRISPFNIGQKIFLNDFSYEEFLTFIDKSGLSYINELSLKRIYFWTRGNPRMVWDLCYEIEGSNKDINEENIDDTVKKTYLTSFDRTPVDNIRELVKKDRDLREAIIQIQYGKGTELPDNIKNKLYLTGIINYDDNDSSIKIKNEIINKSLDLEWIKEIDIQSKGFIVVAIEQYEKGEYRNALDNFEKYLQESEFKEGGDLYYYYMGYSAYVLLDFTKSLAYLEKTHFKLIDQPAWYFRVLNLKGLVAYHLEKYSDSLKYLEEVVDSDRKDEIYYRSLLNYSSIALVHDNNRYKDIVINNYNKILSADLCDLKPDFINEIKSVSFYNLARIEIESGHSHTAIEYINKAYDLADKNSKPTILLTKYGLTADFDEKQEILTSIINYIDAIDLKPSDGNIDSLMSFNMDHFKDIYIKAYLSHNKLFVDKLEIKSDWIDKDSLGKALLNVAMHSIKKASSSNDIDNAIVILSDLTKNIKNIKYNIDNDTEHEILKYLAYFSNDITHKRQYIQHLRSIDIEVIDVIDIDVIANVISKFYETKKINEALRLISYAKAFKERVSFEQQINFILIDHFEAVVQYNTNNKTNAHKTASQIISTINSYTDEDIRKSYFKGHIPRIKKTSEQIIEITNTQTPPITRKSLYGRNEKVKVRYINSSVESIFKYKNVESDVASGKCIVIEKI